MKEIALDVKNVVFKGEEYLRYQDALLKRDTIENGGLAIAVILNGKVWRLNELNEELGHESDITVIGDDVLVVDVVELIAAMFDTLDVMLDNYAEQGINLPDPKTQYIDE